MENKILVDTTQDLTFEVTHKVIKVKFVIILKLYLACRYINIYLLMMLQLVLGSISVSYSNIDKEENQTQKCVFLRDSYSLPVLF